MKLFYCCFILILLGQDAFGDPRPDFGLSAKVAGSALTKTVAAEAYLDFDQIDFKTITLKSQYSVLKSLNQQMTTIGANIAATGKTLTTALETLAPSTGPLPQVYSDVTNAIGTLRALLETGLVPQTTIIEQLVGTYISDMLSDATRQLIATLNRLTTQINLIQKGVNDAIGAYGTNINIPDAFLRRYVSPKVVYELLRILQDLKSDLPLVTFIVELTLGHLSTADAFLLEFLDSVDVKVYETVMHYDTLKQEVVESSQLQANAIVSPLQTSYRQQLADIAYIKSDLEAMDTYNEFLKPVLVAYETLLGTTNMLTLPGKVDVIYNEYLKAVVALDDYLDRFYNAKLCAPVRSVLNVLIASGPWADYCFSKYSPRLLGLVSVNSNRFLMCYQIEATRLSNLSPLVDRLVVQILFDIDDLAQHLVECFNRIEDGSNCIASIAPYYSDLAANLNLKVDDVLRLLTIQTKASASRAAACVASGKCGFVASTETYIKDVKLCEEKGPKA
ncbi:uncharacterized protein LOC126564577 [Anopheles maculipalpis]|uniref:uncharacterized protein LOC126564577 n=1 Tax=Anopheles maculipalpis TaxID=1496333 RepID=UPI0021599D7C|nr:uncharacterized protein LOC126564577 [Anopheles maculipalpis]